MGKISARLISGGLALIGAVLFSGAVASAASLFGGLPVGQHISYRIVAVSDDGQTQDFVTITRVTPTVYNVSANGAPPVPLEVGQSNNLNVPPQLKRILAPFGQIGTILRGAPQPLDASSSWVADMPVPLKGSTDNVPLVVNVASFGQTGVSFRAVGQNSTTVRPRLRSHDVNLNLVFAISLNPARLVSYAQGIFGADAHGRLISKSGGSSWTVTQVSQ